MLFVTKKWSKMDYKGLLWDFSANYGWIWFTVYFFYLPDRDAVIFLSFPVCFFS